MLHLLIYATEVLYCGVDEADAGKGYLKNEGILGTSKLNITGSRGSMYMMEFWDMDQNLNYIKIMNILWQVRDGDQQQTRSFFMTEILLHWLIFQTGAFSLIQEQDSII